MSNEERLADIQSFVGPLLDGQGKVIGFDLTKVELDFLFKLSEHALHLERKYENTGSMFGRQAQRTLIDENKRLHEALVIAYSHCDDNLMDETIDVIRMALDGDDVKEIWADELVKGYRALEDNS